TGAQISAITAVDHRPIGTGKLGDVTSRLRKIYFDVVRGKVAKYRDWCHTVYEVNQKRTSKERTHVTVERISKSEKQLRQTLLSLPESSVNWPNTSDGSRKPP